MKEHKMEIGGETPQKFKKGDKVIHEAGISSFGNPHIEEVMGFTTDGKMQVGEGKTSYLPSWEKGFLPAKEGIEKAIEHQKKGIEELKEKIKEIEQKIKEHAQQIELLENVKI